MRKIVELGHDFFQIPDKISEDEFWGTYINYELDLHIYRAVRIEIERY